MGGPLLVGRGAQARFRPGGQHAHAGGHGLRIHADHGDQLSPRIRHQPGAAVEEELRLASNHHDRMLRGGELRASLGATEPRTKVRLGAGRRQRARAADPQLVLGLADGLRVVGVLGLPVVEDRCATACLDSAEKARKIEAAYRSTTAAPAPVGRRCPSAMRHAPTARGSSVRSNRRDTARP